MLSQGNRAMPL